MLNFFDREPSNYKHVYMLMCASAVLLVASAYLNEQARQLHAEPEKANSDAFIGFVLSILAAVNLVFAKIEQNTVDAESQLNDEENAVSSSLHP